MAFGTPARLGARKRILNRENAPGETDKDPFHPDAREFALAVADFALLYDPRDPSSVWELDT